MSNTRKINGDLSALLDAARLPERTVELCLRGDLQADWEDLQQQLAAAQRDAAPRSLSDPPAGEEIEERIREVEAAMAGAVLTVRLRAQNRKTFKDMALKHPPREGDQRDKLYGFNVEAFNAELIRISCVEPEFDEEKWERLTEVLTPGQYQMLADTCEVLNHSQVDVPFSSNGSARAPTSAAS